MSATAAPARERPTPQPPPGAPAWAEAGPAWHGIPYKWLVAIAFVTGFFMDLMDTTIVNVALPTLVTELHTTDTTLEWVVTGYLLSLAVWIPASGWIGDRFGTKRTFLFALAVFTCGSALCSLAPSVELLILFRILQGVGGGMMTPVGVAMLFRAFPPQERAAASAVLAIPAAAAPALGPVLGGWLVDYVGWRWIFLVNVPIGIAAFLFGLKFLSRYKPGGAGRFDFAGFLLSGLGLTLLLYALSSVPTHGFRAPDIILAAMLGVALLALLVWVESHKRSPILHFSLFRERLFRTTNIIFFFAFALWLGSLFVMPLFLQQYLGLTAFQSGLTTSPQAVGWIAMSTVASCIYHRLGPKVMVITGLVGSTLTTLAFIFFDKGTNLWLIRGDLFLRGLAMAFAVIPIQAATFTNVTPAETGRASALFNTNRQVASSFGVAVLGAVLFELLQAGASDAARLSAYHAAFLAATGLGLIAVLVGFTIHNEDAAASYKAPPGASPPAARGE